MSECKFRAADGECLRERAFPYKEYCVDGPCTHYTSITNADRIRAMTDEELAQLFADDNCGYCRIHDFCFAKGCRINCEDMWLAWLRQEATDDP